MISFNDFYNKYNGKAGTGDTSENKGQCVGLVEVFWDEIGGIPHVYGNAQDLYANAPTTSFTKIPNSPTAVPQVGDVIVWNNGINGTVGHTGIATGKGDINTFECFEQNDPTGSAPRLKTYNYNHVVGWLRAKNFTNTSPTPTPNPVVITQDTVYDLGSGNDDAKGKKTVLEILDAFRNRRELTNDLKNRDAKISELQAKIDKAKQDLG